MNKYHGSFMRIWKTYEIHDMWMNSTWIPVIVILIAYENFKKNFTTHEKTMKPNIANSDCYKRLWIVKSDIYTLWITFKPVRNHVKSILIVQSETCTLWITFKPVINHVKSPWVVQDAIYTIWIIFKPVIYHVKKSINSSE